ncbi:hypothetical protein PGT21_035938 [Puccinia graminis f. sp. tritici]|uniref:Uncharacterized protein n=1 Tax=Puccinia graminis f. sp. tritici TaxID=56615 RepID=A0A5B0PIP7_PUCGR|nr:hypothetical protein PGT21_035938 [Puccinia graminis f. sp. tritici]KAA1100338.1 hypothetical protein PGTUg99_018789 [Puccinia graminis f. sp. tritici]
MLTYLRPASLFLLSWGFLTIQNATSVIFKSSIWDDNPIEEPWLPSGTLLEAYSASRLMKAKPAAEWKRLWEDSHLRALSKLRAEQSGSQVPLSALNPTTLNHWRDVPQNSPTDARQHLHHQEQSSTSFPSSPIILEIPSGSPSNFESASGSPFTFESPPVQNLIGPTVVPQNQVGLQHQLEAQPPLAAKTPINEITEENLRLEGSEHAVSLVASGTEKSTNLMQSTVVPQNQASIHHQLETQPPLSPGIQHRASQSDSVREKLDEPWDPNDISLLSSSVSRWVCRSAVREGINSPSRAYCSRVGQIKLLLHKTQMENFREKLRADEIKANINPETKPHSTLPIGITLPSKKGDSRRVSRILRLSNKKKPKLQSSSVMLVHYRYLLAWIHPLHQDLMNRLNLPTSMQRSQHQKLVDWIDEHIFKPDGQFPALIGTVSPEISTSSWASHKFGPIHSELIDYFGQDEHLNYMVPETAPHLVDTFQAAHEEDYLASNYLDIDDSTRTWSSPESEKMIGFLFKMLEKERIGYVAQYFNAGPMSTKPPNTPENVYLQQFYAKFYTSCDKTNRCISQGSAYHPKLSITMDVTARRKGYGLIRISKEDKNVVPLPEIYRRFNKLVKALYYFHSRILAHLKVGEHKSKKRKGELFLWLIEIIIGPKKGHFPLVGFTKINENLAPWEDVTHEAFGSLKQIHVQLIKYFSQWETEDALKRTAAVVTTAWFQEHYPADMARLIA